MRVRLPYALAVVATLLLLACSGEKEPGDANGTPSPSPEATTPPTSRASLKDLGIETTPIRWVPTPSVFFTDPIEPVDPFAADRELQRAPSGTGASGPQTWSVHLATTGSPSREIYSTRRWITSLAFNDQGRIVADFTSRREFSVPPFSSKVVLPSDGVVTINPSTGHLKEEWDALLSNYSPPTTVGPPNSTTPSISISHNRQGDATLVTIGTGAGPFTRIEEAYLIRKSGETSKLEGITGLRHFNWLPDGQGFQALVAFDAFPPNNNTYFIPVRDGDALYLASAPVGIEGNFAGPVTGASSSRLLFVIPDKTPGAAANASRLVLYEMAAGRARLLGAGPAYPGLNANGFPNQLPILWPANSDSVQLGVDVGSHFVNLTTGALTPGKLRQYTQQPATPPAQSNDSPDGRYSLTSASPDLPGYRPTDECRGLPYRIDITDKQAGTTRPLIECNGGTIAWGNWLTNDRVLVHVSPCIGGCDAQESRNLIVEVSSGKVTPLNPAFETNAFVRPSPDGSRMLIGGSALRLLDGAGNLLRTHAVAAGQRVTSATWSPDGSSYAYIEGPVDWFLGYGP